MRTTSAGFAAGAVRTLPFAALSMLLAVAPDAVAQKPSLPTACGSGGTLEAFESVTGTSDTITATFKNPMPSAYSATSAHAMSLCYPRDSDDAYRIKVLSNAQIPVTGTVYTVTGAIETGTNAHTISAATDYWLRFGNSYGNQSPWKYVRTAGGSTTPTIPTASPQGQQVTLSLSSGGTSCAACPVTPTGYAVPGPGVGEITVHWTPGTDTRSTTVPVTGWQVFWGTSQFRDLVSVVYDGAELGTRSHVYTGLTPGREYGIAVSARESTLSNPTNITGIVRAARYHVGDVSDDATVPAPAIDVVRVVSAPTHDSDDDGVFDTYVAGDKILFDVEFSEPVEVTGGNSNVRLRIDLGADDADLTNSRKTANLDSVLNGGRTLRFVYTVEAGPGARTCSSTPRAKDCDPDGVWVQTFGSDQVIVLAGTPKATIASAETGAAASLTMSGLPTAGGQLEGAIRAKVDGGVAGHEGPTPTMAEVNGATLTVTFSEDISWASDGALIANLDVRNVGDFNGGHRNVNQHPMAVALGDANTKLVLTLGVAAKASDTVTLTHHFAGGRQVLQDASGNKAPAFRDLEVTNNTPGVATAAVPVRADVAGKSLQIVFDRPMERNRGLPSGNVITVHTTDNSLGARTIKGTGTVDIGHLSDSMLVTLEKAVRPDEQATVSYKKPTVAPLEGVTGGAVQSFDRFRIETVRDVTAPTFQQRTVVEEGSSRFKVFLYFDEPLDESSVPLTTGSADTGADFSVSMGGAFLPGSAYSADVVGRTAIVTVERALPSATTSLFYVHRTNAIRDLAGNPATGLSGGVTFNRSSLQSGQPALAATDPVVAEGDLLTLTYTKTLDPASVPAASAFSFSDDYSPRIADVEVVLDAVPPNSFPRVLLHLEAPVVPCAPAFTLSYAVPGTNPIQGLDGTDAAALTNQAVTRKGVSARSQCVTRQVSGSGGLSGDRRPVWERKSVTLKFDRALDRMKTLDPGDFAVDANGASGSPAVQGAAYTADGSGVTLTLGRAAAAGETATVGYRWSQSGQGLWDAGGNQIDSFEGVALRNAAPPPALAVADATAGEGETLEFAVTLDTASASEVTVDYATSDDTATAGEDYESASGTLTFAAGETEKTITVQALADTASEDDETFTLTLSNASGATLGDAEATGTVAEVDTPPVPVTAEVDGGTATVTFNEDLATVSGAWAIGHWTIAGTGANHHPGNVWLSDSRTVSLTLGPSNPARAGDTVTLSYEPGWLADAAGNRVAHFSMEATNLTPPVVAVDDASASEGANAALEFAVRLNGAAARTATVDWATSDGTATAGADYTAGSGTLTFAAGETSKTVRVAVLEDTLDEGGETLTLTLSNPTGATLGDAEATGTIADAAAALPTVNVADAAVSEGGTLSFAVTLDAVADGAVTVDYATADGTAIAGSDYRAVSGTLTFAAGETAKTVNVATHHDAAAETDETFTLTLSNAAGATLGDAEATGTVAEVAPLTASLADMPAEHDGTNAFSFELAFGEDFPGAMAGATLAGAFTVGNGSATGAVRIVAGQNRRWTVTVQPSSTDDVTLSLAAGAVTTEAGRPLANAVSATVAGPALLSVADAEADEGRALSFAVTLDRAASGTVTVGWATADGTATAGSDYTSASGTLTFSAGETAKAVAVQALTDNSAEDDETFTLNLSNASGAAIADGAATGTVIDVPPLTASFANLPAEHDGSHRFGFEIVFSEEFDGMRLTAFAAGALQVAGGRLIDAKRAVRGQNQRVAVRVRPDSNGDLTLTLASATDCNAAHAVCAKDGRVLSNTVSATVSGPALLSVGDVEATEGEDENVVFTVSLNRAAAGTATVDYATADRTAHAGEDYTATSGTLAFAPGETSKTVAVPLLDDAIDDDGETFALELRNARGSALGDRVGLATIRNSDPVPKAWLVRFSRAATDHAADAVQRRFDDRGAESHATFGGHRLWGPGSLFNRPAGTVRGELHGASGTVPGGEGILPSTRGVGIPRSTGGEGTLPSSGGEGILPSQAPEGRHARHGGPHGPLAGAQPLWRDGITPSTRVVGIPRSTGRAGTLPSSGGEGILPSQAPKGRHARHGGSPSTLATPTLHDLLQGSSFLLSLSAEEEAATPRRLTTWGNAATTHFNGLDGNVSVDGEVATYLLGADLEWNRWLAGVALAHSVGHGGFQADTPGHKSGELDSSLTAMHPYLRWRASDRLSAWGMLGYGTGTLDLVVDETKPGWTTDTSMRMAAAGMRGVLSRTSGMELAAKLDARLSHIASDAAESASGLLGDTAGGTSRLRLALEGSRAFAVGTSRMLTPTLDLGLRHDGGDAETGAGVDLGGTLRYADAQLGLTAEASGRWLLAHEDAAYREWGASATVRVDPGTSGRGLSLSLQPSWGATATGGADRLWSLQDARGLAAGGYGMDEGMRLDADVGWAFDWFRGKGAMRPFLGMRTSGPSRDWRAGIGWRRGQHLEFGFEASRRELPTEPPDHGIELRLEWRPGFDFGRTSTAPASAPPNSSEATEAAPET